MTNKLKQPSLFHLLTISDPDVQNGYEEVLSPYFCDCRIMTVLDLIEAIRRLHAEIAAEGNLSEQFLKYDSGFILGILSLGAAE